MDHDSQLIWETYVNTLPDEVILAVKQALEKGHTFTKIASDLYLTVHMVKRIAGDKSGIGPDMDVIHPRGHVPGVPFNSGRYWDIITRLKNGERPAAIARDKDLFPDDPETGDPTTKSRQYIWKVQQTAKERGIL